MKTRLKVALVKAAKPVIVTHIRITDALHGVYVRQVGKRDLYEERGIKVLNERHARKETARAKSQEPATAVA